MLTLARAVAAHCPKAAAPRLDLSPGAAVRKRALPAWATSEVARCLAVRAAWAAAEPPEVREVRAA